MMYTREVNIRSASAMMQLGEKISEFLRGGEVIELVGDVGAGKTTLVRGIARGLGVVDPVQSPTFTISRLYEARDGLTLAHYDFYRLSEAGIMTEELREMIMDGRNIVIIEWAGSVEGVLPEDCLRVKIETTGEDERRLTATSSGDKFQSIVEEIGI